MTSASLSSLVELSELSEPRGDIEWPAGAGDRESPHGFARHLMLDEALFIVRLLDSPLGTRHLSYVLEL